MQAPTQSKSSYRFGLFELDLTSRKLLRKGEPVRLQELPFRLLTILLERPGEIVTREELRQSLWPEGTYVEFDGSLNAALKKLRFALGDDAENPIFIETVPKRGYRFISPVSVEGKNLGWDFSKAPVGPDSPIETSQTAAATDRGVLAGSRTGWKRNPVRVYGVASCVLLAAIALGWLAFHKNRPIGPSAQVNAQVPLRRSAAVLGFHNVSGRPDDVWLSTAFSEMLSTELAGDDKLRLVSSEDVANLRLSSPWPQTGSLDRSTTARIGTALNSDLLILGSYTVLGRADRGRLRLDVCLQNANTGEILTEVARTGDRQDLFQLVSGVGAKLRSWLGVPQLEEQNQANVIASLPANPEAARFYSLGLIKLREWDYLGARGLFEQTTKADAKFPLAYSMLSRADMFLGHDDQAKKEAKRGLDLAGQLSRVQRMEVEASYYQAIADRGKAAQIYKVLFNLFPDSLDYGLQLAKLQLESYHPDEALATIQQLRQLPPPARDDPRLDLEEGRILGPKDQAAADRLYHSAAVKAKAQGKKLTYATAQNAVCWVNDQHVQSPPECREAYEIFLAAGNRDQAARSLQLMAEIDRLTSHEPESVPLYLQAAKMFREAGDRQLTAVALNNLSLVLENEGQWSTAERTYLEALQNFKRVNDKANTSVVIENIADIVALRGHLPEAKTMYQQSWELADASAPARDDYAHIQHASLLLMEGDVAGAKVEIEAQVASLREYAKTKGDPWQLAAALTGLGDVLKESGDLHGARRNYQEALETLQSVHFSIAGPQVSLAELAISEGHGDQAEALLRQAVAEFEKGKSAGEEIGAYTSLSRALLAQRKIVETQDAIAHAFKLANLDDFPVLALPLEILRARAMVEAAKPGAGGHSDLAKARTQVLSVLQHAQRLGLYQIECEARLALGEVELRLNPTQGRAQLATLAFEARRHGLELYARKAEQAITSANLVAEAR